MGEKRLKIPFYARYLLTVNEAACYFNIGAKKMRTLVSEHEGAKWMIYNGNRIMIKRELLASWVIAIAVTFLILLAGTAIEVFLEYATRKIGLRIVI